MGVYVTLVRFGLPSREKAVLRTKVFLDFVSFAKTLEIFKPEKVTVWKRAPSKTLGGVIHSIREINGKVYAFKREIMASVKADPLNTIVEFSGTLTLIEEKAPAIATCFNDWKWRVTYGDMYLDVIDGAKEDFAEYLLNENGVLLRERMEKIYRWIANLAKTHNCVRKVEVGIDPLVRYTVFDALIIYRRDWKELISDALTVASNVSKKDVKDAIRPARYVLKLGERTEPYKKKFLVESIGNTLFVEWLRKITPQKVHFEEGSILIGAREKDDIRQLFHLICQELLKVVEEIPEPEDLQGRIKTKAETIYGKDSLT